MYPLMAFSNVIAKSEPKDPYRAVSVILWKDFGVCAEGKPYCSSAGSAAFESQPISLSGASGLF